VPGAAWRRGRYDKHQGQGVASLTLYLAVFPIDLRTKRELIIWLIKQYQIYL